MAELPKLKADIAAYQGQARTCPDCGQVTQAALPAASCAHSIGPGLAALRAYLVSVAGLSKRRVEELIEAIFDGAGVGGHDRQLGAGNQRRPEAGVPAGHRVRPCCRHQAPGRNRLEKGRAPALVVVATINVKVF